MGTDEWVAAAPVADKAELLAGRDFWSMHGIDALGIPAIVLTDGPRGRRPAAEHGHRRAEHRRRPPGHLLPAPRWGSARTWDPGLARARRVSALGRRVARPTAWRDSRPGHQHQALAAVRAQLRVLLRGPARVRRDGRRAGSTACRARASGASLKHFAANNQETDRMRVRRRRRRPRRCARSTCAGFEHGRHASRSRGR
ncbi:MAG: hypothetical protein V9F04_13795 [Dermatophilaceae bacterium]